MRASHLYCPTYFGPQRGRAKDPVKYLLAVEQRARERQVAYETVKLLRQEVMHCKRKNGVNAHEVCQEVNQAYYDIIMKKDFGQLHPNWAKPEMKEGWGDIL